MTDVIPVNVPNHGGGARHSIASGIEQIGGHGGGFKHTDVEPSDLNRRGNTGFHRDVMGTTQAVVFSNDFHRAGRPRIEQPVFCDGSVAC